jgi:hypothetical protein
MQERAEARRALGTLQALRLAIPASISSESAPGNAYLNHEKGLLAKANGEPPKPKKKRYTESKKKTTA